MSSNLDDMIKKMQTKYQRESKAEYDKKHKAEKEQEARRNKEWEECQRHRQKHSGAGKQSSYDYESMFVNEWMRKIMEEFLRNRQRLFEDMVFGFGVFSTPVESFKKLEITDIEHTNVDEVQRSYRRMAILVHPDKGGTQAAFVAITEARDKCIQYLNSRRTI